MHKLLLLGLVICFGSATQAATLRTATTLHAPTVRLSDLFDDAGTNADRVLGPGPGPGGRIVVEAAQLRAIAHQFGVSWVPSSSADRAVLDRPGRPMRREDVLDAVRTTLLAAGVSDDCDIELGSFTPPLVPFESDPKPLVTDLEYDANAGRFTALLSVSAEAMEPIHLRLAGRVDDTVELPVSTGRLPAGSVVRPEDLHMARVHTASIRGEVVRRAGDAIGMQARRQIAVGQPLVMAELARPTAVQKKATVLMQLDSPGIALTAQGQALEAGALGERIRVINPVSHATVEATVIGPDRVRVLPSGGQLQ